MKNITIDCTCIESREQLHSAFAAGLSFPEWYGNNLDALYDCLSAISEPTHVSLPGFRALGSFAKGFRLVLEDAESENDCLIIDIL